jgi:hypothetical protein
MPKKSLELQAGEKLLFEKKVVIKKGKMSAVQAQMTITDQRVVVRQFTAAWAAAFGLLGALFSSKTKGQVVEMPSSSVTSVEQTKFGINDRVLVIHGSEDVTVIVKNGFDDAVQAFQESGVQVKLMNT